MMLAVLLMLSTQIMAQWEITILLFPVLHLLGQPSVPFLRASSHLHSLWSRSYTRKLKGVTYVIKTVVRFPVVSVWRHRLLLYADCRMDWRRQVPYTLNHNSTQIRHTVLIITLKLIYVIFTVQSSLCCVTIVSLATTNDLKFFLGIVNSLLVSPKVIKTC